MPENMTENSPEAEAVSPAHSVLIVDDEIETVRGIIDFFKDTDWKVLTAVDERETIMELEHKNPRLVLLDLVLEKESGFEVLTRIRNLKPETKVIIISKYFDHELIEQAMKAGAIGFVQKAQADVVPSGFTSILQGAVGSY
jgi:DNA-binding NtrC family response regulator